MYYNDIEQIKYKTNLLSCLAPLGIHFLSGTDSIGTPVCLCVCLSVLRFQNSQHNLYWGQSGARYSSVVQYKQLARCTPGRLFPRVLMYIVHRKFLQSQEILVNIFKKLRDLISY